MPDGATGSTPDSGSGDWRFESSSGSYAAAHGCGPAFVPPHPLHAALAQSGRGAAFRTRRFRVRVPGAAPRRPAQVQEECAPAVAAVHENGRRRRRTDGATSGMPRWSSGQDARFSAGRPRVRIPCGVRARPRPRPAWTWRSGRTGRVTGFSPRNVRIRVPSALRAAPCGRELGGVEEFGCPRRPHKPQIGGSNPPSATDGVWSNQAGHRPVKAAGAGSSPATPAMAV